MQRLDLALVARGLSPTRARARDAILRGAVTVDGRAATKAGQGVDEAAAIALDDPAARYVSRAALKLVAGLDAFGIDPSARSALDVGASTGGFTQVLLERGAAHVVALDVGHGQLAPELHVDGRVTAIEGMNARDLDSRSLPRPFDLVVADVSFISLRLALAPALDMAPAGAECVLLVKPQFEAGRDALDSRGVVRDQAIAGRTARDLAHWLGQLAGWHVLGLVPSPIKGGDGNAEWLLGGRKDGR